MIVRVQSKTRRVQRVPMRDSDRPGATLRWCSTHQEPVWVYPDKSFSCPYDLVIEARTDGHQIEAGPWEVKD